MKEITKEVIWEDEIEERELGGVKGEGLFGGVCITSCPTYQWMVDKKIMGLIR